jgi:formiminotetrahydrofolate cyclodeaminase
MAGALVAMVARLSIGKEGMKPEAFYVELAGEAERLSTELFNGGREDSEAFEAIRAGYRLPKETSDQKAARSQAIQAALTHAARVPLANAVRCQAVLELHGRLHERHNPNAASDLACARYLAQAGVMGCVENVNINVPSIKDDSVRADLSRQAQALSEWLSAQADS